jgi:adenine-specific DNA-methyltransferase
MENVKKFQELLRELFQFDCADLDFGIYRIMNYKRDVIEQFIQEKLPKAISHELEQGALAGQSQAAKELEAARKKVLEALGDEALSASGVLNEQYHSTNAGKDYLAALEKAKSAKGREALEATIYNHLYTFFNRYYQDGDFISKRRYSKRERYAIPYNGEEVMLYWANHDQYYIKTGEYFTDYTWKASNGVTVHFKLTAADVEQNNVKGEKRFFLPQLSGIAWDESAQSLTIPFEFRPLNGQEAITYGGKNQQEAIIAKAVENIPKQRPVKSAPLALAALDAEKRRTEDGESVTHLEHHLRQYIRGNTSDFFIHKDLKGFLSRELDFYLKNEVLNLDEMDAAGVDLSEGWFQMMRLIKKVGSHIIAFLAQIEEFQKMLWEKRKFVAETFYCITMSNVPEEFYPEIVICEAQWEEWKMLLRIGEEEANLFTAGKGKKDRRMEFLKTHPTLVLDTRHFSQDPSTGSGQSFTDRLLASFDDLDEAIDGLLLHSENWQALNLLTEKYREQVNQIHIDPPYNTDSSGFLYKNDYRHASWLSMMVDRLLISKGILLPEGTFTCHIDENEFERLRLLCEQMFGYVGTAVWDKLNPMMGAQELAIQHEYILFCTSESRPFAVRPQNVKNILSMAAEIIRKHKGVTEQAKKEFTEWVRSTQGLTGGEKAYQYLNDDGHVYRLVAMTWPNPNPPPAEFFKPLIHPVTGKPCPVPNRGWSQSPKKMGELLAKGKIVFGPDETTQPQRKIRLSTDKVLSSIIRNGSRGKTEIEKLGLDFTYNHPVTLYTTLLDAGLGKEGNVLDFFAGSGTSGHAVINLNREDGGRRKFILVEMAHYFDTVLLPRIKKVTFSPEWKDGKPKRMATAEEAARSPRIVKVIRLESYEDALNNIAFDDPSGQQAMQFEDYLLQYMLKWETRHSETLLNVGTLDKPFSYQLHIHRDGETRTQAVDLPETFAYLLGLNVRKRQVINDSDRRYLIYHGDTREGRKVAVIWRETEGWKDKDYTRDKVFVASQQLTEGVDDVYVNGDSYIPGARALEPLFKARMFADVEA